MTTIERVWMTRQAHDRLQAELADLRASANAAVTESSDENFIDAQRARHARVNQIHDLLLNAVIGEDPPDDGVAEPGMVLTIRYDETGDTETFLLGARDAEHGDIEVYSIRSPLGAAIVGAREGEKRTFCVPSGKSIPVTLLEALPYGVHRSR
jgi:transcription elongation GreA/GreB family factor